MIMSSSAAMASDASPMSFMEAPDFAMDYSDTLFSTFNQLFPDPKEICENFILYHHSCGQALNEINSGLWPWLRPKPLMFVCAK